MKKRLFTAFLTLFALAALAPAAFAAVEAGGVEYVWYTGDKGLYISADCGASYGVLPELEQARKRTGLAYAVVVTPTEQGGLAVKGRDIWSTEYTWFQEYSAAQLAAAVKNPVSITPVEVHATNGTVTVGSRYVMDEGNDDLSRPLSNGNLLDGEYAGDQIVYSLDGATWQMAQGWHELGWLDSIWWDGEKFQGSGGQYSADGVHWTKVDERKRSTKLRYACDLGKYHFEVVNAADWLSGNDVYLMDQTSREVGVLLPDLGKAIRAMGIGVGNIQAWYTPNDTVTVAVYDVNQGEKFMYSLNYPISSLDWCLENLSKPFRTIEVKATDGKVSLGLASPSNVGYFREEGSLLRNDGSGWKPVTGMYWGNTLEVLPYNGKTFMVQDTAALRLYASEDGLNWREVGILKPEGMEPDSHDYISYGFAWTGKEYIVRRKAAVGQHGMMGMSGGQWYEGNTKVYFLTDYFHVTGSYDFGRLVEKVGYLDGYYYAQVGNSTGTRDGWGDGAYNDGKGYTLYRSADGRNWTALGQEYLDMADILVPLKGGPLSGNLPTNDPNKPLRTAAQVGKYRFILARGYEDRWEVHLLAGNAADEYCLSEFTTAIQENWISPGEVTAEDMGDGKIRVTVTDLSTPSMKCSISYTTQELDQGIANPTTMGYRGRVSAEACKPGVVDVAAIEMPLGEVEIVYRDATTNGKYMWYDSVPWSNSVVLLPYSGKDFFLLDKVDGKLYRSADGRTWQEAAGDLFPQQGERACKWPYGGNLAYSIVWTGSQYLVSAEYFGDMGPASHVGGYTDPDSGKVFFLDENLNVVSSYDFGCLVKRIGYADGVYYAEAGNFLWDGGRYSRPTGTGAACYRSTDGVNWEKTDIFRVREALGLSLWAE